MSAAVAPAPASPPQKLEKKPIKFSNLLLGAGLNMFEVTTLGQPLEVTKTTMAAHRSDGFATALGRIWNRGGILGFYQGLIPWAWIEASTKGAVLLFVASEAEYYARNAGANEFGGGIIGGVTGGVAQAYATMGFCTCMKTVEITKHKVAAAGQKAPGTWATFMDIYRREGIRGINKGVNAVAIRQMTNWGSRFGLSRLAEQGIRRVTNKEHGEKLNAFEKITASALGGGLSAWNQPIEVIRVEMQSKKDDPNRPKKMTVGNTFRYIYDSNGIKGLYRGVAPRIGLGIWQTVCMVAMGDMYVPFSLASHSNLALLTHRNRAKTYVEKLTGDQVTAKH
ncbi:mitochondrial carrier domain-containing protein [Chaetomium tenue]|uniref:Mitochondrial carrier domain-containing protein n=1 Tax=Chaetomium tenue TaxID=1854479 RepID=A0ACB7P008_9PEZI|nr:mitochondrial carrier domain-containing protein [Chaetomium globosum]